VIPPIILGISGHILWQHDPRLFYWDRGQYILENQNLEFGWWSAIQSTNTLLGVSTMVVGGLAYLFHLRRIGIGFATGGLVTLLLAIFIPRMIAIGAGNFIHAPQNIAIAAVVAAVLAAVSVYSPGQVAIAHRGHVEAPNADRRTFLTIWGTYFGALTIACISFIIGGTSLGFSYPWLALIYNRPRMGPTLGSP
jgi:hypothetical protein